MRVADIMTHHPVTIHPQDSLRRALEVMDEHDFHHLPVVAANGILCGVVTARECRLALGLPEVMRPYWESHQQIDQLQVRSVMTTQLITAEPEMDAAEAARLMLNYYVSGLPVVRDETLVGIVTISDVLIAFVGSQELNTHRVP